MHSVIYETAPPGCIKTNRNVQGKIVRIYGTLIKDRFFRVKEKVLSTFACSFVELVNKQETDHYDGFETQQEIVSSSSFPQLRRKKSESLY
jgi:hypothetical protein